MAQSRYQFVQQVMQGKGVRAKLDEVADRAAAKVRPHVEVRPRLRGATVTVTSGTRPLGRPYARVTVTGGASEMDRRQILAAAIR